MITFRFTMNLFVFTHKFLFSELKVIIEWKNFLAFVAKSSFENGHAISKKSMKLVIDAHGKYIKICLTGGSTLVKRHYFLAMEIWEESIFCFTNYYIFLK